MERGKDSSFWPKLMLHPSCFLFYLDLGVIIVLKPCDFCKTWYNFYDVTMTSCKYTYHSFCLGEMLKNDNKCLGFNGVLHPKWWNNFGFREKDEKLQTLVETMKLNALWEELKQALHKEVGFYHLFSELPIHGLVVLKDFVFIMLKDFLECIMHVEGP